MQNLEKELNSKIFGQEKAIADFDQLNESLREASTNAQRFAGSMMPLMGNLTHINYAINCCVGGLFAISGALSVGSLLAFLQYVRQVSQPVTQISQQMNVIMAALAGAERIFKVLDEESEVDDGYVTLVNAKEVDGQLVECEEHTTELRGAKEATCTEAGYTGDTVCVKCNKTITKGICT